MTQSFKELICRNCGHEIEELNGVLVHSNYGKALIVFSLPGRECIEKESYGTTNEGHEILQRCGCKNPEERRFE